MDDLNPSRRPAARMRPGGLLALFLLAGLPALVTPLRADNPPTFLFQWGSEGTNNGQFEPTGIAVDSGNNVYVIDAGNFRIEKFDSHGNYLTQLGSQGGGYGNGQFAGPTYIAFDSSNNVYVADFYNDRVQKFDGNGNYLTQWGSGGTGNGQFQGPYGIAVDSSNNVYVTDENNSRVEKFDDNGNYLTQWGNYGTGNGQFEYPEGIAVDSSNNVYVADSFNYRIEKSDSNGNYLTQWGSDGSGNGQFQGPEGIAVDSSNNVYVADTFNDRIEKFTSNGSYLAQSGSGGSGAGQFIQPIGIAVDSTGNFIYVADEGNDRIEVFVNNPNIVAPIITSQPISQLFSAGANVTLSVGAIGTLPLAYQWISNSVAVPSATNATFLLTNVNISDSGIYSVLVTNSFGSTLSSNAVLFLPAGVITQSASSISSTGAVLNGSVSVGSDQTIAWFEWGTDTNYGNISGETVVPGDNSSNNINTTLSGLPGNIYHYRIDATNDVGIVYGNDVSFTVGFAPTVTNLSPIVAANGATLMATVNPNGWDTKVYFKWGPGISRTYTTTQIDAGTGATFLNFNSLTTGLTEFSSYSYQAFASNSLGTASGAVVTFLSFPFAGAPPRQWQSVATSADGSKIVAAASGGGVYISTNSGATWNSATNSNAPWEAVAMSANGSTLIAAVGLPSTGSIYISTNFGTTFAPAINAGISEWNALASSADGSKLAAATVNPLGGGISVSTNSGVKWVFHNGFTAPLSYVASSANGLRLIASPYQGGSLYTSTNGGVNWTKVTNAPFADWYSVASSASGNQLLACSYPGNVFISTNGGVNWAKTSLPTNNWNSVAESADGTKAVALANSGSATFGFGSGGIWTSTDSGNTWVSNNVPSAAWTCAAMSADGNEFIAVIGSPSSAGGIYVSQTTPAPVLNLSASDNTLISWMIPSLDFTLQQSPDLMNWTDVTNQPALNLTNLQNQVALPPPDGNSFFRLMH